MAKKRTRANGEGTIYQNANQTWTAQITTPAGDRRSKTSASQRKVRAWLTEQRRDMDTGDYIEPSEQLLSSWWDKWVDTYKRREVAPKTLSSYSESKARLSDELLLMPISDIRPADIQSEINRLSDKGLKRRTIEITRTALQMCLQRAVLDQMIRSNPVKSTTLPEDDSEESVPLTPDEESELIKIWTAPIRITANGTPDKNDIAVQTIEDALFFALKTGCRRGEAVAIKWDDINTKAKTIRIRGTKNDDSDRVIPLTPEVITMLDRRRFTATNQYVFSTRKGKPVPGTSLLRWMNDHTNHTVHDLRHTYCTRGAQAGVNPKVLQTLTGHKRIETLLQIYTHVSEQDKADAAAKISGYCKSTANAK